MMDFNANSVRDQDLSATLQCLVLLQEPLVSITHVYVSKDSLALVPNVNHVLLALPMRCLVKRVALCVPKVNIKLPVELLVVLFVHKAPLPMVKARLDAPLVMLARPVHSNPSLPTNVLLATKELIFLPPVVAYLASLVLIKMKLVK
jgi:hypothetical protein